jgi:hypothetical protein
MTLWSAVLTLEVLSVTLLVISFNFDHSHPDRWLRVLGMIQLLICVLIGLHVGRLL